MFLKNNELHFWKTFLEIFCTKPLTIQKKVVSLQRKPIKIKTMGWVKQETITDEILFDSIKNNFLSKASIIRRVQRSGSNSVYEYLTDFIKDYYNVTLEQCDRIAVRIAKYYGIETIYSK